MAKMTQAERDFLLYEALGALADMVNQFGYCTTFRRGEAVCDAGLSALEYAFGVLEDAGCKVNSNGSIQRKRLFEFMDRIDKLKENVRGEIANV